MKYSFLLALLATPVPLLAQNIASAVRDSGPAAVTTNPPATSLQPKTLAFEVIAIHPTDPSVPMMGLKALPGGHGYTGTNVTVLQMISVMYRMPTRQIQGAPDWAKTTRWSVEARADGEYNKDQLHEMYKQLLADRFGLKFHHEDQTGNIYALTIDPSGNKMKPNQDPDDFSVPIGLWPDHIVGKRVPLSYLTWWLSDAVRADERPVVDRTQLKGFYDFTLYFQPPWVAPDELTPDQRAQPDIFTALREQLGLKITPEKGPVDQLVIDSIQKPSEN